MMTTLILWFCVSIVGMVVLLACGDALNRVVEVIFYIFAISSLISFVVFVAFISYNSCPECEGCHVGRYCDVCGCDKHPDKIILRCPNCGEEYSHNETYCVDCGIKLKEN